MVEGRDSVTIQVESLINKAASITSNPTKPTIYKVDDHLRRVNSEAYDPEVIAIGPIHHGRDHVKVMEKHKVRYLIQLLQRKDGLTIENYVVELRQLEEKARQCYAKSIKLDGDKFVEMLLLDGCFVIELIRKCWFDYLRDKNDQIFQHQHMLGWLRHDLMLFENQVPLFVLNQLFFMTKMNNPEDNMRDLVLFFVKDMFPWPDIPTIRSNSMVQYADHLLGLVYENYFPDSLFDSKKSSIDSDISEEENLSNINSMSELKSAGIKVKRIMGFKNWGITFMNGVMKLPQLKVSDKTESLLRNLIAYEQSLSIDRPKYVTDYAFVMHCLVNSREDVEILRRSEVITNLLGDDEMLYLMLNTLGKNVLRSSEFCYSDIFRRVNRHTRIRHNTWMANLKHNYFNSPWAFTSFLAAVMLLLLTSVQTVFTMLSYFKQGKPKQ